MYIYEEKLHFDVFQSMELIVQKNSHSLMAINTPCNCIQIILLVNILSKILIK